MKVVIQAMKSELTEAEIKKHVPAEKLKAIQGKGVLKAYIVAQEGESNPKEINPDDSKTNIRLSWPKQIISKVHNAIKSGSKFFIAHGKTNSHEDRKPVGEIVGKFFKNIGDKLSNVIIGHFENPEDVRTMDVNSMEADVSVIDNIVQSVEKISAIALGNSETDVPAFEGAQSIATIQCFGDVANITNKNIEGDSMEVKFSDVVDFIKNNKVYPNQLFNVDDLKDDHKFSKIFDELKSVKESLETKTTELESATKSVADAKRSTEELNADSRFKALLPENLTEKQSKYIIDNFDAKKCDDLTDESLKKVIASSTEDFSKMAKLFSNETETEENTANKDSGEDSVAKSELEVAENYFDEE